MPSPNSAADFLLARLKDWGVRRIFGHPGDGINGVIGALERAGGDFEFIQVAHEEVGALAACAHAKFTGELGVCLATQGPGAIHLLNGLYDAKLDRQPVLAIVGQPDRAALGSHFQQEVNLAALFQDVASAYLQTILDPAQVRHVVDRAVRIALAERAPTCLIFPHDVQQLKAVPEPPREHGRMHSSVGYTPPRVLPAEPELRRAAEVLNGGRRVALLVGSGALGAAAEVREVAEVLGAGVAKALLGKAVLPDDLPFVTGTVGWLGTTASNQMMEECDTLLLVGTTMPYTEYLPKPGQAAAVQIDVSARLVGVRYPTQVNLIGDAAPTLRALLPMLETKRDRTWRERVESLVRDWWQEAERRARLEAPPINPEQVFRELSRRLPDHAILTGDCGTTTVWYARDVKLREGMAASLSGTLATMGSAVPYAVAAKFAQPLRPVIAMLGDGAMQMLGQNALITVAKYWQQWPDPRFVVLVLSNRDLNYVSWEQRVMEGFAKYPESQDLIEFPFAQSAELLGLRGIRVDRPEDVGRAWDAALASDRPVVLEASVSAAVPSLPPSLRAEQRRKLEAALAQGDPDADDVTQQLALQGVTL
ncbi:MAG TPA: thiamine pyrophosphate-requiring protein [Gemmatimonadales bacterium]|nr:thiamine pyrophosphate-requiring protein [Gemmatimonadales bacterium]